MRYIIAGSGFDNANLSDWTVEYRDELNAIYHRWKADRTVLEFFDFIFNQNGYRCEDFFESCWAGSQVVNCCAVFKPTYVMLRGRCFRLIDDYNQTDVDETDKLSLHFKDVQGKLPGLKTMAQVVMYVGDPHPEVGIYPRTYLNHYDWNRVRFTQRHVAMLPDNPQCSLAPSDQGKSTCFVYNWLMRVVLKPLNCTLPYFKGMLAYGSDMPVCEPSVIVNDYKRITSTRLESYHCLPACERVENQMQMLTSPDYSRSMNYSFRVETSFTELQYERYSEIRLTTWAGFISELGGQSGLFVGCSVMSVVQLVLSTLVFAVVASRTVYTRYLALALHLNTKPPKKAETIEEVVEQ